MTSTEECAYPGCSSSQLVYEQCLDSAMHCINHMVGNRNHSYIFGQVPHFRLLDDITPPYPAYPAYPTIYCRRTEETGNLEETDRPANRQRDNQRHGINQVRRNRQREINQVRMNQQHGINQVKRYRQCMR